MKTLLIVEDDPSFSCAAVKALSEEYQLLFATCSTEAIELLGEKKVDGVITDICFNEFQDGTSLETREEIITACTHAAEEIEFGKQLIPAEERLDVYYEEMYRSRINCFRDLQFHVDRKNSHQEGGFKELIFPTCGFFVIQYSVKNKIPVTFLSSRRHAPHILPVPVASGLLTLNQFIESFRQSDWESDFDSDMETPYGIFTGSSKDDERLWKSCARKIGLK
jgi:hypothetical protein